LQKKLDIIKQQAIDFKIKLNSC